MSDIPTKWGAISTFQGGGPDSIFRYLYKKRNETSSAHLAGRRHHHK